jgi:hypothetical protein
VALVGKDVAEERINSIIRVEKTFMFLFSVFLLLVSANVVPSSPILVTLMMEAVRSSEMSVHTRAIRCNIPKDDVLQVKFLITEDECSKKTHHPYSTMFKVLCRHKKGLNATQISVFQKSALDNTTGIKCCYH